MAFYCAVPRDFVVHMGSAAERVRCRLFGGPVSVYVGVYGGWIMSVPEWIYGFTFPPHLRAWAHLCLDVHFCVHV